MDQDVLLAYINDENATECLRLSCWDFGGQDSFYGLHHLYIGRQSVYALMFNMEWFMPHRDARERQEHLDYLAFWLKAIEAHARDPADNSVAPIVLVGSHKDTVHDEEEHKDISKMVEENFGHYTA